jgi:hypothetical protein
MCTAQSIGSGRSSTWSSPAAWHQGRTPVLRACHRPTKVTAVEVVTRPRAGVLGRARELAAAALASNRPVRQQPCRGGSWPVAGAASPMRGVKQDRSAGLVIAGMHSCDQRVRIGLDDPAARAPSTQKPQRRAASDWRCSPGRRSAPVVQSPRARRPTAGRSAGFGPGRGHAGRHLRWSLARPSPARPSCQIGIECVTLVLRMRHDDASGDGPDRRAGHPGGPPVEVGSNSTSIKLGRPISTPCSIKRSRPSPSNPCLRA